jgi:hypothetical protein
MRVYSNPLVPDGFCREKECQDESSQVLCTANVSCTWDDNADICYTGEKIIGLGR